MAWKLFEKVSGAAGLLDRLGWQFGRETTQIIIFLLSPGGCTKHKQYSHREKARTIRPCCFEWKLAPASDLHKCSHFIKIDAPEWSIHPITPGWSIWRCHNGSSPVVVCTYWSPQRETDPSAPHQTCSFSSRGRSQASWHTCARANPMRICLCTSAEAGVWPPVKFSCPSPKRMQRKIIAVPARHHGASLDWVWATIRKAQKTDPVSHASKDVSQSYHLLPISTCLLPALFNSSF